jgi:hypothetical protein
MTRPAASKAFRASTRTSTLAKTAGPSPHSRNSTKPPAMQKHSTTQSAPPTGSRKIALFPTADSATAPKMSAAHSFVSAVAPTDKAYKPHPQRDENIVVARVANQLFYYTGDAKFQAIGKTAMRYLAAEPIATRLPVASVLLANYELTRPPLHLTVVGSKADLAAQSLFRAALQYPSFYKRVEWWDTREGKLPNPDVQYPSVARPAAYICIQRTCSPPIFSAGDVSAKVNRVLGIQDSVSQQASAKASGLK